MATTTERPPWTASLLRLWLRLLHWRRDELVANCDRIAVLTHVTQAGELAPRYGFMIIMSCGIAVLGLLQNSAAVIIGAMLISPLMAPIVELGMGLATFDFRTVKGAMKTIGVGVVLAVITSAGTVLLSPIREATPEILARTTPNLFDLLVAIFSGLAGAYATITRKGETIVGVAIATALMPPIAVFGYGIAVAHWDVVRGAGFLFMTNLLAIALSVTIVARVYGFGGQDTPKQSLWQAVLIIGTFAVLSVPLGLGLRRIALQSQTQLVVKDTMESTANAISGRFTALRVERADGFVDVDAVLMAPAHIAGLPAKLERRLALALGAPVRLRLREVLTTSDAAIAREQASLAELRDSVQELRGAADARSEAARALEAQRQQVRDALLAQFGTLRSVDEGARLELRLRAQPRLPVLQAWRLERSLRAQQLPVPVDVVPAGQRLPPIPYSLPTPDAGGAPALAAPATIPDAWEADAWALQRWAVSSVDLSARYASGDAEAARREAERVAAFLRSRGIGVDAITAIRDAEVVRDAAAAGPAPAGVVDIEAD